MFKKVFDPTFSLFGCFYYDFVICIYFIHMVASSTVTDDFTNQVVCRIFNTNLQYSCAAFTFRCDSKCRFIGRFSLIRFIVYAVQERAYFLGPPYRYIRRQHPNITKHHHSELRHLRVVKKNSCCQLQETKSVRHIDDKPQSAVDSKWRTARQNNQTRYRSNEHRCSVGKLRAQWSDRIATERGLPPHKRVHDHVSSRAGTT